MQRIDENTYIDDTLVTCAEYQLFVDEMHEQGKYYQPDHWVLYQFPAGKALDPILGVRQSDSVSFCEWLTNRDIAGWKYRLPSKEEAVSFHMKPFVKGAIGYWLDGKFQFAWVGSTSKDVRLIEQRSILDRASAINRELDLVRAINRARVRALDIERDLALAVAIDHIVDRGDPNYPLNLDLESTLNLDFARDIALRLNVDRNFDLSRNFALGRFLTLDIALNFPLDLVLNLDKVIASNLDDAFDLYVDIFTLQERIDGRSPAFEGIRLVKERIKYV